MSVPSDRKQVVAEPSGPQGPQPAEPLSATKCSDALDKLASISHDAGLYDDDF